MQPLVARHREHCFFRKHRYTHNITSRSVPFKSIPYSMCTLHAFHPHDIRMTSALHALHSRRGTVDARACNVRTRALDCNTAMQHNTAQHSTSGRTREHALTSGKKRGQTQSQHTFSTQSTHSQHTVNIQSTHSQQAASKTVLRDTHEENTWGRGSSNSK